MTLLERARTTSQIAREDVRDLMRTRIRPGARPQLGPDQERALKEVRRDGIAVVPGYWPREKAAAIRDRLLPYLEDGSNRDFDEGAYLRFYDDNEYDQGVRRIFHVERLVPELAEFRRDPYVLDVASAYYRMPFHSTVLMYQYNTRSNDNTRYYHVDSFKKEFKSFLYLDDVDEGNGPFTYLLGSHRRHLTRLRKQVAGNEQGAPTSFYPDDLGRLLERELQVCGPAGTLILADVRGLHRGSPQLSGARSVLVNYIAKHEGDVFPGR